MPRSCFVALLSIILTTASAIVAESAELKPETISAFDRYVAVTEARMQAEISGEGAFLWIDRLSEGDRDDAYKKLRSGEVVVEKLETRDASHEIDIPHGSVHHWIGTIVIPGVSVQQTIDMVQDYDRYAEIYAPHIVAAEILQRHGTQFMVFARLYEKKVLTFVANTEYDVDFIWIDDKRIYVPSHTTRIAEVQAPDTPEEQERPVGDDRGFLWRFNNYCSFEERQTDTFMQCESISLTRDLPPFPLNLMVRPFVSGIPKDKMTFTLKAARRHLTLGN